MGYTRTQLKQVMQAERDLVKKKFKLNPVAVILGGIAILGVAVGISAVIGALAGLALSAISLPPLIAGGIIGSAILLVSIINKACCGFQITTETDRLCCIATYERLTIARIISNLLKILFFCNQSDQI